LITPCIPLLKKRRGRILNYSLPFGEKRRGCFHFGEERRGCFPFGNIRNGNRFFPANAEKK